MGIFWLFSFISLCAAVQVQSVSNSESDEIRCFVQKEASACDASFKRARSNDDGRAFAEVACDEIKNYPSCVDLGDWYTERAKPIEAKSYFTKACDQSNALGCARLVDLRRQDAEKLNGSGLAEALTEVQALTKKICKPEVSAADLCRSAEASVAQMSRGKDATFGSCVLNYRLLRTRGEQDPPVNLGNAEGLSHLLRQEECLTRCRETVAQIKNTEEDVYQLRGRCVFAGKPFDSPLWKNFPPVTACSEKSTVIGEEDAPLYDRCHCESADFPNVNKILEKFGAYARGEASYKKRVGKAEWFRCGLAVYFENYPAPASEKKAQCVQTIKNIKKAIGKEPSINGLILNLNFLKCPEN